jgi:hypothetical protein
MLLCLLLEPAAERRIGSQLDRRRSQGRKRGRSVHQHEGPAARAQRPGDLLRALNLDEASTQEGCKRLPQRAARVRRRRGERGRRSDGEGHGRAQGQRGEAVGAKGREVVPPGAGSRERGRSRDFRPRGGRIEGTHLLAGMEIGDRSRDRSRDRHRGRDRDRSRDRGRDRSRDRSRSRSRGRDRAVSFVLYADRAREPVGKAARRT